VHPTVVGMSCDPYREAASARLDGEVSGMPSVVLDDHLARCQECSAWLDTATRAGRLLRVSGTTPPDLSESILHDAGLPAARLLRRRRLLQLGLVVLAALQWALAVPGAWGENIGMGAATQMGMQMGAHQAHESAAWNVAVGAALLAVALRPARAAGTVPILLAFVAVLSVLSVPDLLAGAVTAARLSSHAGVVLGLVLVAVLARADRVPSPGRPAAGTDGHNLSRSLPRRHRGAA
jgi:predicted anti-sigma-YlaC factor YlaD